MKISKDDVIEVLKTVKDPEIHVDIWTMGLIYGIEIKKKQNIIITMTYTTPFCPWGPALNKEIINSLKNKLKVSNVEVIITFDPPYTLPPELRATLGI